MKKLIIYTGIIATLFVQTGCSKNFLKETSTDLVRPTTTDALNQLLMGEAYPIDNVSFHVYLDMLTDDVQMNFNDVAAYRAVTEKYASAFTWQADMPDRLPAAGATGVTTYETYYQKIKGCNVVLDYINQVQGTEAEKKNLRGQALAVRSYLYFMLVNLYGKPFNHTATNPDTDPGVPLLLTAEVTSKTITRASLRQVYDQVESDLKQAIELLPAINTTNSVYRFNKTAATLLLSRVYLYKNDWDNCIKYSDLALQSAPLLKNLNAVTTTYSGVSNPVITPAEVIWAYGNNEYSNYGSGPDANAKGPITVSDDLLNNYEVSDLRLNYYFSSFLYITNTLVIYKGGTSKAYSTTGTPGNTSYKAFRSSEAYLNRAEAWIQKAIKGDANGVQNALNDLNTLRRNRIKAASYQDLTITDPAQLLAFCKAERRRELFMEDHRWFDLRRWGMPKLTHSYQNSSAGPQTFTLNEADSRYTLRFSQEVLSRNSNLQQNP